MKKTLIITLSLLFPFLAQAKLKVVTTIPDLAALAREVGQDRVEVESLARGDQDLHYLEPRPSYSLKLNRADLLIDVGLDLEIGWLPVLLTQSRNPKIRSGQPGQLNAHEGIRILEIPTGPTDRSLGDIHPSGNPHYWLDPRNGLVIAERIAGRFAKLDPSHASSYQENYESFRKRLTRKIGLWEKETMSLRGQEFVTYHRTFSYFTDWTGLKVAGVLEPKPGIPPSPAHILPLVELMKRRKVPLIFTENYYDPKPPRELSKRTGARVLFVPTSVGGESSITTYEGLFDYLIAKLKEVL